MPLLVEIHDEMYRVEVEIFKTRCRIKQWMKYRDVTQIEEQRAIQSLQRELAYMIDNYVVLSSRENLFFRTRIELRFRTFGKDEQR